MIDSILVLLLDAAVMHDIRRFKSLNPLKFPDIDICRIEQGDSRVLFTNLSLRPRTDAQNSDTLIRFSKDTEIIGSGDFSPHENYW